MRHIQTIFPVAFSLFIYLIAAYFFGPIGLAIAVAVALTVDPLPLSLPTPNTLTVAIFAIAIGSPIVFSFFLGSEATLKIVQPLAEARVFSFGSSTGVSAGDKDQAILFAMELVGLAMVCFLFVFRIKSVGSIKDGIVKANDFYSENFSRNRPLLISFLLLSIFTGVFFIEEPVGFRGWQLQFLMPLLPVAWMLPAMGLIVSLKP